VEPLLIEVDGSSFRVRFNGFHQPLAVEVSGGEELSLPPWTCREHLDALRQHLMPGEAGLALDTPAFCDEVLARSGIQGFRARELAPLALWWASGGGGVQARCGEDGLLQVGPRRFRLQPWTQGDRMKALAESLGVEPNGAPRFDAAAYLEAMLKRCVEILDPAGQPLGEIDAEATAALVTAVVALNVPESEDALGMQPGVATRELAVMTLRICRALGWTPSQVWALPAPEVDRILALLDATEGTAVERATLAVRTGPPRLADHPDAIVIQIEDDAT
jgi:hypothetical protein